MWQDAAAEGPGCAILSPDCDKFVAVLQRKPLNF
jgi:hypothetical protein